MIRLSDVPRRMNLRTTIPDRFGLMDSIVQVRSNACIHTGVQMWIRKLQKNLVFHVSTGTEKSIIKCDRPKEYRIGNHHYHATPAGVDCMGINFERVLVDTGDELLKRLADVAVGNYSWVILKYRLLKNKFSIIDCS